MTSADDTAFLAALGTRIVVARIRRRWTQERLAERAGLDRSYLSRLERGRHNVTVLILRDIANGAGIPLTELLPTTKGADARCDGRRSRWARWSR